MTAGSQSPTNSAGPRAEPVGLPCPYQGLEHFTEEREPYFFGRDTDTQIIFANLLTTRLMVLHSASGVGKSSVLLAGILPRLRAEADVIPVVVRDWQSSSFHVLVRQAVTEAMRASLGIDTLAADRGLADVLQHGAAASDCEFVLIFDQFEEYFRSRAGPEVLGTFEAELAALVNREEVPVHLLLSLREDSLALLDRLEGRIPGIFGNCIRLEHLGRTAAEKAIRLPLERFAETHESITIDDPLVELLLDECAIGRVGFGSRAEQAGAEALSGSMIGPEHFQRIELPFLQLLLRRLWQAEMAKDSTRLRLSTLEGLGGVSHVVCSHLDQVLEPFSPAEKRVLVAVFDRLVTPSGSKIAYAQRDLEAIVRDNEPKLAPNVRPVLVHLADSGVRVLRELPPPPGDTADGRRFELLHDVLGHAVLDWLRRTIAARRLRQAKRRIWLVSSTVFAAVLLALLAITWRYYDLWVDTRPWGRLTSLLTGQNYPLAQDLAHIGRSTDPTRHVPLQVELLPSSISRFHLTVSKDARAIDMRSLYGTTINGEFLPYGDSRPLVPGDILVLAGTAAFRYDDIGYRPWHFVWPQEPPAREPAAGWALLIDAPRGAAFPLTLDEHYVLVEPDGGVRLGARGGPNAVLAVRIRQFSDRIHYTYVSREMTHADSSRCGYTDQIDLMVLRDPDTAEHADPFVSSLIALEDLADGRAVTADMKKGDYCYGQLALGDGEELVSLYDPVQSEWHSVHGLVFRHGDAVFQIIPVEPGVEREPASQVAALR
jgi:FHA domain